MTLPDVNLYLGAVGRAVLIGVFLLNPSLRGLYTDLADALVRGDASISMPADLRLRLVLARGTRARVGGGEGGFLLAHLEGGKLVGYTSFGSIYFPPFAWHLVRDMAILIDRHRWAEVSSCLSIAPETSDSSRRFASCVAACGASQP